MSQPAAKQFDQLKAVDMHLIQPPNASSPSMVPHDFDGQLDGELSDDVWIERQRAATVGSTAKNMPPHVPQGGSFVNLPTNQGSIISGSTTVFINGKAAARNGDEAQTCTEGPGQPGHVVASGSVYIG